MISVSDMVSVKMQNVFDWFMKGPIVVELNFDLNTLAYFRICC